MTIGKLIKELEEIAKRHGSKVQACADTQTLRETCNDAWNVVRITKVDFAHVSAVDGDGRTFYDSRGHERTFRCVVLK